MGKGGWGIGSADKCEFSLCGRIFKVDKGVSKRRKAVCYSVMDAAIDVSISYEAMDHFSSTH